MGIAARDSFELGFLFFHLGEIFLRVVGYALTGVPPTQEPNLVGIGVIEVQLELLVDVDAVRLSPRLHPVDRVLRLSDSLGKHPTQH